MNEKTSVIKSFDAIAIAENGNWNHNNHFHRFLFNKIKNNGNQILDIGCGAGDFCRYISPKFSYVTGVDFSPKMIDTAIRNSSSYNIEYLNKDILECDFENDSFDCIVSVATMHHLPYLTILGLMKKWLNKGGTILILDLFKNETLVDYLLSFFSIPANIAFSIIKKRKQSEDEK